MADSAKDTQSAGVGLAHAVQLFTLGDGERWFVAQTLCHREQSASLHLGAQGFRSLLPRFHKTVRHARSLGEVIAPVFPGYIFVVLNPERWRWINGTFGVARLVSAHQVLMPVPTGVIAALLASVDELGLARFERGLTAARGRRSLRAGSGRAAVA
jgi:transcriptional antiterminator RfaH